MSNNRAKMEEKAAKERGRKLAMDALDGEPRSEQRVLHGCQREHT